MNSKDILNEALKLKPEERLMLLEAIVNSLDQRGTSLDEIWAEEAEKRLKAYREGRLEAIPMEEVFQQER